MAKSLWPALVKKIETLLDSDISDDQLNRLLRITEELVDYDLRQEDIRRSRERTGWYASDLGGCSTGPYFDRLLKGKGKEKIEPRNIRIMASGRMAHDWIEEKLSNVGNIMVGKERELYHKDEVNHISGQPDYLLKIGKYFLLYDIKTVNSKAFWWNAKRGYVANDHHVQQIHWYRDQMIRSTVDKLKGVNKDNILMFMLYVSRDDWSFQEIKVPHSKEIDELNRKQLDELNEAWETKTPPKPVPMVIFNKQTGIYNTNWKAKYNRYYHLAVKDKDWQKKAAAKVKQLNIELKLSKGR